MPRAKRSRSMLCRVVDTSLRCAGKSRMSSIVRWRYRGWDVELDRAGVGPVRDSVLRRRRAATFLAVAVCLGLLAGCDPDTSEPNGGNGTQSPDSTGENGGPEVNAEAQAAAQAYAEELSEFAAQVSVAVEGWHPFEDDASEVEALAGRVPVLAEHTDVEGTPSYLAAQRAEHTVKLSVDELTLMTELDFDGDAYDARLREQREISEELREEYGGLFQGDQEEPEGRQAARMAQWREYVVARQDLAEGSYAVGTQLYGEDRLARSFAAFFEHTSDVQLGIWQEAVDYLDTAQIPELGNHSTALNRTGYGLVLWEDLPQALGESTVTAFAEQIESVAQALSAGGATEDMALVGDAYRALISEGFETEHEGALDFFRYLRFRYWMLWRIGEIEEVDSRAFAEAEALLTMQLSPDESPSFQNADNYYLWAWQMRERFMTPFFVAGDGSPSHWIPSAVEWATFTVERRPPPAWIAADVEAMIARAEQYVADVEALVEEDERLVGQPITDLADEMQPEVDEIFARISERVDDPVQLAAAIDEALEATRAVNG